MQRGNKTALVKTRSRQHKYFKRKQTRIHIHHRMDPEEFRLTYLRLCKSNQVEALDCVIDQLKKLEYSEGTGKPVLNLSANSIPSKTCAILGKVLVSDRFFIEVKFADCMLNEDGVKGLCQGLANNVYCKKADLKGNNIRGSGAEAIGKMLRHNHSLLSICLEWNAVGMIDNSFAIFSEGVGSNSTLQSLDLRNNQISHDGAAELASALKRNKTLRSLDLRWNNIGLLGGRSFIELLKVNKTLCRIELAGNNVPSDILKSLETAISHNEDRYRLSSDYRKKTNILTKHMNQLESEKALQLDELMGTIDKQEELLRKSKRTSSQQIGNLQETLEERKGAFNSMAAKLAMTESEMALLEQKVNDYNVMSQRLKEELSQSTSTHQNEIRREREERASEEMKLLKELSETHDRNIIQETKMQDLERKCKQQQEQIYELKEQNTHLQAELKMKATQFDEKLGMEKMRTKDLLRETDSNKQKDLQRLKQENEETEKVLRDRIQKLEMTRLELEEEISRHKTTNMTDKVHAEEQLTLSKQRIKSEEEHRHKQLEERLRVVQSTKDELQCRCNQQSSMISDLQSKNSNLTLELESTKQRVAEMSEELAAKNSVTLSEVGKVRIELNQTLNKLEQERHIQVELREKLSDTDRQLSEKVLKHRDNLEEKDRELISLQERLRARELELSRIREEEAQRAQMLQAAVLSYVNRT